ncbi:PorT family protein [Sphingobacteriaceae bacterium WQ 2009]|uniref:PorT family protein n=1 Tax=Rhinopithecimicrobium faecis TaxID=2820698 RepID=A0A8T4HCJ6_9SPHI|nr:PorT family protein [Sphingobacteriaceae bacterium WQ 2009]
MKFILLICGLLFSAASFGQQFFEQVHFGISVGNNLGVTAPFPFPLPEQIREVKSYKTRFNPTAHLYADYAISEKISVGLAVGYERKSALLSQGVQYLPITTEINSQPTKAFFTGDNSLDIDLGYLTVPIYLKYQFSPAFSGRFGPYLATLLSSKFTGSLNNGTLILGTFAGPEIAIDSQEFDNSETFRSFDFGLSGALAYRIKGALKLQLGLNYGLLPVFAPEVRAVELNFYNVYSTIGFQYSLK